MNDPSWLLRGDDLLIYSSSMLADVLLLYRCYVIWDRAKRIRIVPALLFVATTVLGYHVGTQVSPLRLSQIYVFASNSILTALIGTHHFFG